MATLKLHHWKMGASGMREAKLLETRDVHPTEIETSQRLRPASEAAIETIIASVEQLGLIKDEIIVRKVKHRGGKLVLVAGLHRLEACRRMDWMVPAKIFDCTDDWAQLMEVDDNLAGAELGALDSAIFLATRKRIYESLHPEAKHGGDRRSADFQVDFVSVRSFAAVTAEKFGLTERHVRRLVSAGEKLATPEINDLRRAPRPITLKDLQEFAKIGNAADRCPTTLGQLFDTVLERWAGVQARGRSPVACGS